MNILDARLQDLGKNCPPKYDPRTRLGVYVGQSPSHVGTVALVLHPERGLVSLEHHAAFHDDFSTLPSLRSGAVLSNWKELVENSRNKC